MSWIRQRNPSRNRLLKWLYLGYVFNPSNQLQAEFCLSILILYLIDYIAYGLHLCNTIYNFKDICRKNNSPTSWLSDESEFLFGEYVHVLGRMGPNFERVGPNVELCRLNFTSAGKAFLPPPNHRRRNRLVAHYALCVWSVVGSCSCMYHKLASSSGWHRSHRSPKSRILGAICLDFARGDAGLVHPAWPSPYKRDPEIWTGIGLVPLAILWAN